MKLKDCPFCGHMARFELIENDEWMARWIITCINECIYTKSFPDLDFQRPYQGSELDQIINTWNYRVKDGEKKVTGIVIKDK